MLRKLLLFLVILSGGYLFGAYSQNYKLWPIELIKNSVINKQPKNPDNYDQWGRLVKWSQKKEVACPVQSPDTGVLLVMGQSNAANHAEKRFISRYPQKVINYYAGKCYTASSPLLGASGEGGEFITPLADQLIEDNAYATVVIIMTAIGGTPISRWQKQGDLHEQLKMTLNQVQSQYRITDMLWHQGESDFMYTTPISIYVNAFNSLLSTFPENNINAPIFIAIATKCGTGVPWSLDNPGASGLWYPQNPIAAAQKRLIDNQHVFLAVDTDVLLDEQDRTRDQCHFAESGQIKTAAAYATAIKNAHRLQ